MSKPILGMVTGLVTGLLLGVVAVDYFSVTGWFGRLCVIGSVVLLGQLFGATIGAALGKPHEFDNGADSRRR